MKDRTGKELPSQEVFKKAANRAYNIIIDLELLVLNFVSCTIPFHSIRKLFYRAAGVKIGTNSFIHMGARFYLPKGVLIGDGTVIGEHCFMDGRASLKIGSNVDIASDVMIYNSEHDINSQGFDPVEEPVEIEDYAFIGPQAIILPGVKIGKGAVVGAGAVVTKDVAPFKGVSGVPAKEIGERRNKNPNYRLGRARLFQ